MTRWKERPEVVTNCKAVKCTRQMQVINESWKRRHDCGSVTVIEAALDKIDEIGCRARDTIEVDLGRERALRRDKHCGGVGGGRRHGGKRKYDGQRKHVTWRERTSGCTRIGTRALDLFLPLSPRRREVYLLHYVRQSGTAEPSTSAQSNKYRAVGPRLVSGGRLHAPHTGATGVPCFLRDVLVD